MGSLAQKGDFTKTCLPMRRAGGKICSEGIIHGGTSTQAEDLAMKHLPDKKIGEGEMICSGTAENRNTCTDRRLTNAHDLRRKIM